jgi:hypothetical protein
MKKFCLLIISLLAFNCYSQETYYKSYKIRNFIDFLKDSKTTYDYDSLNDKEKLKVKFLSKKKCVVYDSLLDPQKKVIMEKLKLVRYGVLPKIELKDCSGNILIIDKSNVDNALLHKMISTTLTVRAKTFEKDTTNNNEYKAGLLMKDDKLYVNLWPFKEKIDGSGDGQAQEGIAKTINRYDDETNDDEVKNKENESLNAQRETSEALFYEIPDDHTAIFKFTEYSINAITIPLKYRFQTKRNALTTSDENITEINTTSEEFSTSVNLSLFGGYSWGKTKFTHRKEIGNRIKTVKNTIGAFLGSSAVELKSINTNITLAQQQVDLEGTIGTVSIGIGFVKSWNKISIGIFSGIDKGVGRISKSWVYDGRPWIGFGVGYDLFKM